MNLLIPTENGLLVDRIEENKVIDERKEDNMACQATSELMAKDQEKSSL